LSQIKRFAVSNPQQPFSFKPELLEQLHPSSLAISADLAQHHEI